MPFNRARPELRAAIQKKPICHSAQDFYSKSQTNKYTSSSNQQIQSDLTRHALKLAGIKPQDNMFVLDIGCGSGLSSNCIQEHLPSGHIFGFDISPEMLRLGKEKNYSLPSNAISFLQANAALKLPFRRQIFDLIISISMLQWLCFDDEEQTMDTLNQFFNNIYDILKENGKAIFQLYPENVTQVRLLMKACKDANFETHFIVDLPHRTTAKKYFLCLFQDNGSNSVKIKSLLCPLGRRFLLPCAMYIWTIPETDSNDGQIEKLSHQHIRLCHQILRKARRLRDYHMKLTSSAIHEKEVRALTLSPYELQLSKAIDEYFCNNKCSIDLNLLNQHKLQIIHIMHCAFNAMHCI